MAYVVLNLLLLSAGSQGFRLGSKTAAASASASFVDQSLQHLRAESSCRCVTPNNCRPDCICDCCTGECAIFPPAPTPTPGGADGCSMEQRCAFGMCWAPGSTLPCGMCQPTPIGVCATDSDCPASKVCGYDSSLCLCESATTCMDDCHVAGCAEGQSCGLDGHCTTTLCGSVADCPPNFDCGLAGCSRKACRGSWECEGSCVNGRCYDEMGYCAFPPP